MSRYYTRRGEEISLSAWVLIGGDPKLKNVQQTTLEDGRFISTIWLGIDHRYTNEGLPLIFESMVFVNDHDGRDLHCERYSTEAEALAGHARILSECLAGQHMPDTREP